MSGKKPALPEDFKEEDIVFFTQIIPHIDDPKLSARISEIVWLLLEPKDPQYALTAIDNYRKISIDTKSWIPDGRECWDRAIQLCLMLKTGAGERLNKIEEVITKSLQKASEKDGDLVKWLSDLLAIHKLGRKEQLSISQKLEELAINFEDTGDLYRSKDYFDAASDWYKKSNDSEKSAEMIAHNAKLWVREAVASQATNAPNYMAAVSLYGSAIQKYWAIPRALRDKHDVDNRIAELRVKINKAGENSLDEMGPTFVSIDIRKLKENAVKAVKGKPTLEALFQLANVYPGTKVESIRGLSEKILGKDSLESLFSATYMSSADGRVIAKRPGADLNGGKQGATIWHKMVCNYVIELKSVVPGYICPALKIIRKEHRLKEADFHFFVSRSPAVPPDRIKLVAKTLYLGYDNDFVGALYLLVPQIENLVRYHLNQNGEKTTNIDINGIENENGLSTIMFNSKVEEIFGADLSFELRAIFCDPLGPNLRNKLAHGLIGYEESQDIYSIYAWWLMFRLVFNTFWNMNNQQAQAAETENA